jgi:predicted ATP-dependent protease
VAFPPEIARFRVEADQTTIRHDPVMLPETIDGEHDEPDLFRLLPPSARRAFDLGVLASDPWFHVFVECEDDVDVLGAIVARAKKRLQGVATPYDVVYVHDFDRPSAPRPIVLPAGVAPILADAVDALVDGVRERLPTMESDEEVRAARVALAKTLKDKQRDALNELESIAKGLGFGVRTIGAGVQTFPILHGKPVSPEQFEVLDEGTKRALNEAEEKLSDAIQGAAEKVRATTRDLEETSRELEEKAIRLVVDGVAAPIIERFEALPDVRTYLESVCEALVESAEDLLASAQPKTREKGEGAVQEEELTDPEIATRLARFQVNVFVTHEQQEEPESDEELASESARASRSDATVPTPPVVFEDNPTFANLFGFLERRVRLGALVSDFTRIRPGALHKASGGVLVLRMVDLLGDALAWDRLKRVLRARAVGHEDPIGPMGLYATTLRPRPCPIATKVVLVGTHELYTQLLEADADFAALFRVKVEIPSEIDRTPEAVRLLDAHLVRVANRRGWGPLDRSARGRALDYACRLTDDRRKLALFLQPIEETIAFATVISHERAEEEAPREHPRQSDLPPPSLPPPPRARTGLSIPPPRATIPPPSQRVGVTAKDLDAAWQERRDRTAGAERHLREMVLAGEVLLATEAGRVGVVNGLSVLSAGDVQFGHPMRITAVVSLGTEGLVDVEREAALGGNLHTKGVAILRGFLAGTFGQERPVALRAQIAFEQSYGEVEGDSASSSELYAILSALADVEINQGIAVTGSVNQLGEIQAIGGVAAKVEGFFDLCAARGLTGKQGVMIPKSCVQHVVLRDDVAAAIAEGRFHLFAVEQVTQGIEVLTGTPAGVRDAMGRYPANSIFGRVERRLIEIAERLRRAAEGTAETVVEAMEASGEG